MNTIKSSGFDKLLGTWVTKGTVLSDTGESGLMGTDSYELILDGNYILHKADVTIGAEKSETLEIISPDNSGEKAVMQFYNSKGESGTMTSAIFENNFTIEGDSLKFEGTFNEADTALTGTWYLKNQRNEWARFIDLQITKQATSQPSNG